MQAMPRRLGRRREADRLDLAGLPGPAPMSSLRRAVRAARASGRIALLLGWTLLAVPVQAVLVALPGGGKARFARRYWSGMAALLGLRIRVVPAGGAGLARRADGRPVVYVANHSSWLDILVLGGRIRACFVSKREVAGWPVVGLVARLGRTVFVSRGRAASGREERGMAERLAAGDDLILFPEGTSSDGSRVLAFHSTFFAVAKPVRRPDGAPAAVVPIVQPVSVAYDRLAAMPVGRMRRTLFSWYGDMDLASHVWRLAQSRSMRATLLFHPPLDPSEFADRKALSRATWDAVSAGSDRLRQNRPVPDGP